MCDKYGGEVMVLIMGLFMVEDVLCKVLIFGVDCVVFLIDCYFVGFDMLVIFFVFVLVIEKIGVFYGKFDIVFVGK